MSVRVHVLSAPGLRPGLLARALLPARAPFPLNQEHCSTWHLGRVAIVQAFKGLGLQPGERVLFPAYHCGSEIEAAVQFGLEVGLYGIELDLEPDWGELTRLAPSARALYVTHFFGFPQPIERLAELARRHGLLLIEDCAHGLFGGPTESPLGSNADAAIFSFRKTLPTPDGGAVVFRSAPAVPVVPSTPPLRKRSLGLAKMMLLDHLAMRGAGKEVFLLGEQPNWRKRPLVADINLDPATLGMPCAALSRRILRSESASRVRRRRNENYRALVSRIGELPGARWIHSSIDAHTCPWVLPVLVDDPVTVRDAMLVRDVQSVRVWGEDHPLVDLAAFPAARFLKDHVLGLPVHQELRAVDIDSIVRGFVEVVQGRQAPQPPSRPNPSSSGS